MHRPSIVLLLLAYVTVLQVAGLDNAYIAERKRRTRYRKLRTLAESRNDGDLNAKTAKPVGLTFKPVVDLNGTAIPDYDLIYEFDQLVDHTNASLGTFKQRFFHTWEFYKPGGPIILNTPGEGSMTDGDAEDQLTNTTMQGAIAQATGGAVVVLEHRFYGESQPHPDNTTSDRFRLHTIAQAIDDFVYFAQNAELAMPGGDTAAIRPNNSPWIFVGGSYSGALASWMLQQRPGVFWGSYSSSGVVQPQLNFWQYYSPVEKYMPANCSADVRGAIGLIDGIFDTGNQTQIAALQTQFNLSELTPSDFLYSLTQPLDWQTLDVSGTNDANIYNFCDALEVRSTGEVATAQGWGAQSALNAWAAFYQGQNGFVSQFCNDTAAADIVACLGLDGSVLVQSPVEDDNRAWTWTICNEVGWLQVGPPNGGGIVSKHYTVDLWPKYCSDAFPGAFSESTSDFQARVDKTSATYHGWNTTADRVFVVNGQRDPWVQVTLSADVAQIQSTALRPISLTDGFHCSDLSLANAAVDDGIANVWDKALETFPSWVSAFRPNSTNTLTSTGGKNSNAAFGRKVEGWLVLLGVLLPVVYFV